MNLITLLIGLVKPMLMEILTSLGMAVVTYTGSSVAIDFALSKIQQNLSGMPSAVAAVLGIAGLHEGLGIICSALAFSLSMGTFKKLEFKK